MKKAIILILLLLIVPASTSCNSPISSTPFLSSTTTKTPTPPLPTKHDCSTLVEYENLLANLEPPRNFIHNDQLPSLGDFKYFDVGYTSPRGYFDDYSYYLVTNDTTYKLSVKHRPDFNVDNFIMTYLPYTNTENINTDLRIHCYTEEPSYSHILNFTCYFADPMLEYFYNLKTGVLEQITVAYEHENGYVFLILTADFTQFNPNNPDHIINRLLNKNTAIQAKDELMQAIYGTPEQSPAK